MPPRRTVVNPPAHDLEDPDTPDGAPNARPRRRTPSGASSPSCAPPSSWPGRGSAPILPFLPIFLKDEARRQLWMIGVVASAYYVGTIAFSSPLRRDCPTVIGRKPVLLTRRRALHGRDAPVRHHDGPLWFVLFRFLEGAGAAATMPAGNSFVADITTEETRSRAYGLLTTAQFGGLVAGPLPRRRHRVGVRRRPARLLCDLRRLRRHDGAHRSPAGDLHARTGARHPATEEKRQRPPWRELVTRPIAAFFLIAATSHFAMGAWEVTWSIWLQHLGASLFYISLDVDAVLGPHAALVRGRHDRRPRQPLLADVLGVRDVRGHLDLLRLDPQSRALPGR